MFYQSPRTGGFAGKRQFLPIMLSSDKEKINLLAERFHQLRGESSEVGEDLRSTDTMFRVAYTTHLNLSKMADRKAHLMLGLNTFVLSFVIAKKKMGILSHVHKLLIPDVMLVLFCLTCIVLAILASRPANPHKRKADGPSSVNWLFFASFTQYSHDEFQRNIERLLYNSEALRNALIRDLYWLGVSLERKYRYLNLCYTFFYVGLLVVSSAFAFCMAFL